MNRHPFRWQGIAFGALFLAIAGNWAVWQQDLLTPREFGVTLSTVLIVAGVLGVVATFWQPTQHEPTNVPSPEEESHEEATDPQP